MYMKVNGVTLHANVQGDGEPLLLLHGFTGSHRNWEAFIPRWSKQFQVIAVDLLGHGLSDCPADPQRYSMEHTVRDLTSLMDQLGVRQANVLGYSMGGRVALSLAIMAPDRVSRLILESASPGLRTSVERNSRIAGDEALADRIERDGIEAFVDYWENIPLFQSIKQLPDEVQRSAREQRLRNNLLGLANSLRGLGTSAQPSWWERLSELTLPVCLIAGEKDEKFDLIARELNKAVPQSVYTKVSDAGHIVHMEQSHTFDTIVLKFLTHNEV